MPWTKSRHDVAEASPNPGLPSVRRSLGAMSVVLITGARGVIGSVLVSRLGNYELRCADLPEVDLRDPRIAAEAVEGCDRVVHLAWDTKAEGVQSGALCL